LEKVRDLGGGQTGHNLLNFHECISIGYPAAPMEQEGLSVRSVASQRTAASKRGWIWPLLVGLVAGVVLGFVVSQRVNRSSTPKGTALLREFSPAVS
jgi:hypothetical protein